MKSLDSQIVDFIRQRAASSEYRDYLRDLLVDLIAINTAPDADLAASAARERQLFERIEREVKKVVGAQAVVERPAIAGAVARDPAYSIPGYAADANGVAPPPEKIYAGRTNLFVGVGGSAPSPGLILHAHVDVVPPWFGPRVEGDRVFGRGSCDNKAQVAVLLAQMRLIKEIEAKFGIQPAAGRVYQFTLDEEIGGNGSLAAAQDPRYANLPVLMHESTDLVPYCAHRGAVYYRCKLSVGRNTNMTAVELFPFVVLALESQGRKIQRETEHPGFTPQHVQTNHGVLGHYGSHPGVVCDHVALELVAHTNANPERMELKLIQLLEEVLLEYFNRYGDKSREHDATGRPKVETHFDVAMLPSDDAQMFRIDVWGCSGHMAHVRECDNAITKAALLMGGLIKIAGKFPGIHAYGRLADPPQPSDFQSIVLEGGQGFTPSHRMDQIKSRMTEAAIDAVKKYCRLRGRKFDASMVEMTFERLHNDAYADSPEIAPMQAIRTACQAMGVPLTPPTAWNTSCDARLYHDKGHPVAIFGAGKMEAAHCDHEFIDLTDVQQTLAVSTLATMMLC